MSRIALFCILISVLLTGCPPATVVDGGNNEKSPTQTTTTAPAATLGMERAVLPYPAAKKPTNVILMIGDGMGVTQISAGLYSNSNKLNLERFPVVGLHKSYSGDNLVTDSAAGATAFSAGVKTYNGAIGVNMDTVAVKTILESAEERGMPTGLVATSSIVHATPASFIAHDAYRKNYEAIAADFLDTEVDLFIGGGKKFFDRREDEQNLLEELKKRGYFVSSYFEEELSEFKPAPGSNFAYLTADGEPLPFAQGRDYLVEATEMAVNHLAKKSDNKGFFLAIEGSQIDWGGHANESDYIISEMLEFDQAVGKVLDFAEKDGNTLVIVTADHETGGYAIQYGSKMDSIVPAFTSDYHTADLIPVFAAGPGAWNFGGVYENTAIYDKMMALLKLKR